MSNSEAGVYPASPSVHLNYVFIRLRLPQWRHASSVSWWEMDFFQKRQAQHCLYQDLFALEQRSLYCQENKFGKDNEDTHKGLFTVCKRYFSFLRLFMFLLPSYQRVCHSWRFALCWIPLSWIAAVFPKNMEKSGCHCPYWVQGSQRNQKIF